VNENQLIKDLCDNSKQTKHDILRNRLQLGEFHHLYRQLRADSNKVFEYCRMLSETFDYILKAITPYIPHISKFSEDNICRRTNVCDTEVRLHAFIYFYSP
jgi:hypothetical protein